MLIKCECKCGMELEIEDFGDGQVSIHNLLVDVVVDKKKLIKILKEL